MKSINDLTKLLDNLKDEVVHKIEVEIMSGNQHLVKQVLDDVPLSKLLEFLDPVDHEHFAKQYAAFNKDLPVRLF